MNFLWDCDLLRFADGEIVGRPTPNVPTQKIWIYTYRMSLGLKSFRTMLLSPPSTNLLFERFTGYWGTFELCL